MEGIFRDITINLTDRAIILHIVGSKNDHRLTVMLTPAALYRIFDDLAKGKYFTIIGAIKNDNGKQISEF